MLTVLFENEDVVAVFKPEGQASIPEARGDGACVQAELGGARGERLFVVHRLDKEVSGVLLFARNAAAHRNLNRQFASREVKKTYLALAHGTISSDSGLIDRAVREFGSGRMGVDESGGKESSTLFEVVERMLAHTLVKAFPLTGRRHQIRVHFYSIGHPLTGDRRYGDAALQARYPRLALHALEIAFHLPSGRELTVTAEPPASFRELVQGVRD